MAPVEDSPLMTEGKSLCKNDAGAVPIPAAEPEKFMRLQNSKSCGFSNGSHLGCVRSIWLTGEYHTKYEVD